uniref:Putative secreted protein n=1 Tax=Xenopsylla cheopis TaxID=163159 RepID=A0A6M2E0N7_XENCH
MKIIDCPQIPIRLPHQVLVVLAAIEVVRVTVAAAIVDVQNTLYRQPQHLFLKKCNQELVIAGLFLHV